MQIPKLGLTQWLRLCLTVLPLIGGIVRASGAGVVVVRACLSARLGVIGAGGAVRLVAAGAQRQKPHQGPSAHLLLQGDEAHSAPTAAHRISSRAGVPASS